MYLGCFQVMDFSTAQLKAHSEEYAALLMTRLTGLAPEAAKAQYNHYLKEANDFQLGCEVHFFRSGKRLQQNGALIPRENRDQFMEYLYMMTGKSTTRESFEATVGRLLLEFPRIVGWLEWWLRPGIASMIFPAKSNVDPHLAQKVPSTSNPVEGQHSNLHSAMGVNHDALSGAHKLYLYVKQREAHFQAITGKLMYGSF